jgi:hypothetical protein
MVLVDESTQALLECVNQPFPQEVEFVISALEAGPRPSHDRQKLQRTTYRTQATLRLFSDKTDNLPTILYTRHVNPQAMGFLTSRRLPLSHGGILYIPSPEKKLMQIYCTILRCREATPGWFEGAVYFNRQQHCFSAAEMLQATAAETPV